MSSRCNRALQFIGALNPAQNILLFRKLGWIIRTGKISITDKDGAKCHPGYYWLDADEKIRAIDFLQKTNEAAVTAPKAKDNFGLLGEIPFAYNNTGGE